MKMELTYWRDIFLQRIIIQCRWGYAVKQIGHNSSNKRCPSNVDLSATFEDDEVEDDLTESEYTDEEVNFNIDDLLYSDEEFC